ncbi:tRNA pseudouridine(13) synthase TruD [Aestuariicella hydrocarbonica]|uniref:tRNA pseudouridine synthase D n=1 Tax=Pseudomaricurvus hydrocarbonicus TaxID=1470433 RepID=A0A9E5T2Z2_9GAMM|nr:tRNA pseudouridine(13) synthase TruD [Aestuariicella hydrocarbonica]NHO68296.1 tRNA pseudouridine(13) synthase TruD [Aestuariicella hydrocarbonica]
MSDSSLPRSYSLDWAYAYGEPPVSGLFRRTPEDFQVVENLGFELTGQGEHVYLHIEKRGENTDWLARQIARLAGVQNHDVGYAGLKDRHAVTRQWFSVYFPKGTEPDWSELEADTIRILAVTRHSQKLRRGAHQSNHFCIRLHELSGDLAALSERLQQVTAGVPNYFGLQRFGHDGNNLAEANRILVDGGRIANRQKRGMMLSAARSYLFNQVLSERIKAASWTGALEGDVTTAEGEGTGPLWGRGRALVSGACLALENRVLGDLAAWCDGLEHVGLSQERRPLLLVPQQFGSTLEGSSLEVTFSLPPGTYATAVLREISQLVEVKSPS